jgi:hypothetical protein
VIVQVAGDRSAVTLTVHPRTRRGFRLHVRLVSEDTPLGDRFALYAGTHLTVEGHGWPRGLQTMRRLGDLRLLPGNLRLLRQSRTRPTSPAGPLAAGRLSKG